jgi:hypothetical protein
LPVILLGRFKLDVDIARYAREAHVARNRLSNISDIHVRVSCRPFTEMVIAGSRPDQVHLGALTELIVTQSHALITGFAANPESDPAILNIVDSLVASMSRTVRIAAHNPLILVGSSRRHRFVDHNPKWSPVS